MEKSSQIAWKIVPLRNFFPLKVVPLLPKEKNCLQERLGDGLKYIELNSLYTMKIEPTHYDFLSA
jgi:hypothetical protein